MKANNYGYANTIGVVIILLGFITYDADPQDLPA